MSARYKMVRVGECRYTKESDDIEHLIKLSMKALQWRKSQRVTISTHDRPDFTITDDEFMDNRNIHRDAKYRNRVLEWAK